MAVHTIARSVRCMIKSIYYRSWSLARMTIGTRCRSGAMVECASCPRSSNILGMATYAISHARDLMIESTNDSAGALACMAGGAGGRFWCMGE